MYISKSFIPILKNIPSEAKIKSHQLMLRVGMIKQSSAGIYSWLPIGLKVMKKIEQIVREEQNRIKSIALAGASVINPTASIVNTPLRMAANTASVDANNPQAAVDEYSRMFSAKQRGQPFTSNRNNLGMLNLTKNNKQKDQLGQ